MTEIQTSRLHRIALENDVIGNILFSPGDITRTFSIIRPEMFYSYENKLIYETMIEMFEHGRLIGGNEIAAYLLAHKGISTFQNGNSVDTELFVKIAECEPIALIEKCVYIRMLYEKRVLEQIRMKPDYESAQDLIDELAKVKEITNIDDWQNASELLHEQIKFIEEVKELGGGLMTGIPGVDSIMGGMKPGEFIIIAARPGVGKSAFAINVCLNVAKQGVGVGIISLEMPNAQNVSRITSNIADMNFGDIMRGAVSADDLQEIMLKMNAFVKLPIYMSDTSKCKAIDIRAKCMNLIRKNKNIGLIIIDYLQLIERDESRGKSTNDEISKVSRALKIMSKELKVTVIALAQLNREIEKRADKTPKNSDLRDSGSLEQDADKIGFLVPRDAENTFDASVVEFHNTKNRNGRLGQALLLFTGSRMRYEDYPSNMSMPPIQRNEFKELPKFEKPF